MLPLTGLIFDIQRFSIHDGPGIRTTVFFKGCPLRCAWCHNPESQAPGPELVVRPARCIRCGACVDACPHHAITLPEEAGAPWTDASRCAVCGACAEACCTGAREIAGREWTVAEVLAQVARDIPFYDRSGGGVTLSGGEPLSQPDFLLALLRACRARGLHTALDTCGYTPWDTLDRIRPHVDLFLYDVKLVDPERHRQWTGVSNDPILANLRALARHGHRLFLRVPIIPGVNDDDDNLARTAELAASLPHLERVHLLPYHHTAAAKYERAARPYSLPDPRPPAEERLAEIAATFRRHGLDVRIRG